MAAPRLFARSLAARFSGLFITESRFGLARSSALFQTNESQPSLIYRAWQQSRYLATSYHPDMPKKPKSAYFLFVGDKRPDVVAEMPDSSVTEIAVRLGELWSELSAEEKKAYKDSYTESKEVYDKELKEFKDSISADDWAKIQEKEKEKVNVKKKRKLLKEKRDWKKDLIEKHGRPKAPMMSYAAFVSDQFKEDKTLTLMQCGEKWKKMTKAEKQVYKDSYAELRQQYEKELKEWKKEMVVEKKEYILVTPEALRKKEKAKKKKTSPKKKTKKETTEMGTQTGVDDHMISDHEDDLEDDHEDEEEIDLK